MTEASKGRLPLEGCCLLPIIPVARWTPENHMLCLGCSLPCAIVKRAFQYFSFTLYSAFNQNELGKQPYMDSLISFLHRTAMEDVVLLCYSKPKQRLLRQSNLKLAALNEVACFPGKDDWTTHSITFFPSLPWLLGSSEFSPSQPLLSCCVFYSNIPYCVSILKKSNEPQAFVWSSTKLGQ